MATSNIQWNESELEYEIENWCLSLKPIEMDAILGELELVQDGTRFARADRLFRRLRGDYTATDFARSEISLEDEDESIRRIQAKVAIENTNLSMNAKNYIYERQEQRVARSTESESILTTPLANSTNDLGMPVTSENAEINATSAVVTSTNTATNVVASTIPSNTTNTTRSTTNHGGILSTREAPNDTLLCRLADGSLYEVRREVAIEMARLQAATRNLEKIANEQNTNTPEYDRLRRDLQSENAASSTRIAAPQSKPSTGAVPRRNVMFQDTFDLRYFREGELPPANTRENTQANNKQKQSDANAQDFQPRIPTPALSQRDESGGGGLSCVSHARHSVESASA